MTKNRVWHTAVGPRYATNAEIAAALENCGGEKGRWSGVSFVSSGPVVTPDVGPRNWRIAWKSPSGNCRGHGEAMWTLSRAVEIARKLNADFPGISHWPEQEPDY